MDTFSDEQVLASLRSAVALADRMVAAATAPRSPASALERRLALATATVREQQDMINTITELGAARALRAALHACTASAETLAISRSFAAWVVFQPSPPSSSPPSPASALSSPPSTSVLSLPAAVKQRSLISSQQAQLADTAALGCALKLCSTLVSVCMHRLPRAFWQWRAAASAMEDAARAPQWSPTHEALAHSSRLQADLEQELMPISVSLRRALQTSHHPSLNPDACATPTPFTVSRSVSRAPSRSGRRRRPSRRSQQR